MVCVQECPHLRRDEIKNIGYLLSPEGERSGIVDLLLTYLFIFSSTRGVGSTLVPSVKYIEVS